MRADVITICVDAPQAPAGNVPHVFADATYTRVWNGIRVTLPDGAEEFFDNLEIIDFQTYTAAKAA